jgi:ribosomal protein S18 acetylase RimI-like enzyme
MDITALNEALAQASSLSVRLIRVREQNVGDLDIAASLYAQTRAAELQETDWTAAQKQAFCRQQFDAQLAHYVAHYPRARFLMIESQLAEGGVIGRLYYEQTASELRLMEITLATAHRNRGIGGAISEALRKHATHAGIAMGLHVESFNPARRLYERQGFREVETRGIYIYMRALPEAVN